MNNNFILFYLGQIATNSQAYFEEPNKFCNNLIKLQPHEELDLNRTPS